MSSNQRMAFRVASVAMLAAILIFHQAPAAQKEQPRSGGELVFAVGGTPPSFDGHRETTFAMLHPVSPHFSTLLRFALWIVEKVET